MSVRCFLVPAHLRAAEEVPAIYPVAADDDVTLAAMQRLFPSAQELSFADAVGRVSCRLRGEWSESNWFLLTDASAAPTRPLAMLPLALAAVRVLCGTACAEGSRG